MAKLIGWLLGVSDVASINRVEPALAAEWASGWGFWLFVGIVLMIVLSVVFYLRVEANGTSLLRISLGLCRGALLALLLISLAQPVLRIILLRYQTPTVAVVFDGTASMTIRDVLPEQTRIQLEQAVGWNRQTTAEASQRLDYLRSWLAREDNALVRLQQQQPCQFRAFLMEGDHVSRLRQLELNTDTKSALSKELADQLDTRGRITAIGSMLSQLGNELNARDLSALIVFSDFAQNAGPPAVGPTEGEQAAATALGIPIHAVGLGSTSAKDLAVDLLPPPRMKRAERSTIRVKVSQADFTGSDAIVTVTARKLDGNSPRRPDIDIGKQPLRLELPVQYIEMPYTPDESGRFQLQAYVQPLDGEVTEENNTTTRQVNIVDDFLRLMYVAYEPNWEWRFVKEVFHRDKLVGMPGFRTYLRSSDPTVREKNELFLPTLAPPRSEFFTTDVIVLGDMPRAGLSHRFCKMTEEFVSRFGGGLVVVAGPRFGPGHLANTPLGDMLPVVLASDSQRQDDKRFLPRLTPEGKETRFLLLGDDQADSDQAWKNLGHIAWYQPVSRLHSLATALLVHPTDTCSDGKTPQPIIAIRRYGKGEVVYLAFDELWRLRRRFGEKYYRQFWSQMINRLGLSHAIGSQKRFVVRTNRANYQIEDKVTLTVEAYNRNFEPLSRKDLADGTLAAEWFPPGTSENVPQARRLAVSELRPGEFTATFPVFSAGEYRLRVHDPLDDQWTETLIQVADRSAEMRSTVRDARLQRAVAESTGGNSYDLLTADQLADDLKLERRIEQIVKTKPLWSTPLWFVLIAGLMLAEWCTRKWWSMA